MAQPNYPRRPYSEGPPVIDLNGPLLVRLVTVGLLVLVLGAILLTSAYVIQPGSRGIKVTLGKTADKFLPEGFGLKTPFITTVVPVNVKQRTRPLKADCFSSDLQQVMMDLRVLYRIPEESVVQIYKQYAGDPFDSLIAPRVQEAVKEVTALLTSEQIVKSREEIKQKTISAARQKIGAILAVEDIVVRNIDLSPELERAIEAKMVAEQQAVQARFTQLQTQVEAETAVIRAKGEAEAIQVRGEALKQNPAFLKLQMVERWNGKSPLIVPAQPGESVSGLLLPIGDGPVALQR